MTACRILAAMFFGGGLAVTVTGSQATAAPEPALSQPPIQADAELFKKTCSQCHDISVATAQRHTPEQWGELVDKMTDLGLAADGDMLDRVKNYLAATYPKPQD